MKKDNSESSRKLLAIATALGIAVGVAPTALHAQVVKGAKDIGARAQDAAKKGAHTGDVKAAHPQLQGAQLKANYHKMGTAARPMTESRKDKWKVEEDASSKDAAKRHAKHTMANHAKLKAHELKKLDETKGKQP